MTQEMIEKQGAKRTCFIVGVCQDDEDNNVEEISDLLCDLKLDYLDKITLRVSDKLTSGIRYVVAVLPEDRKPGDRIFTVKEDIATAERYWRNKEKGCIN